jgi:hypothetical protein
MIKHGPVDVVILAAGEPKIDGSILGELHTQAASGTIRVLDAMVLLKDDMGAFVTLDLEDMPQELKDALGFINTGTRGLFDSADAAALKEGMVPGSGVLALAIEHVWAVNLVNAMERAGMDLAFNFRIPAPIVDEAFASLEQKVSGG